MGVYNTREGVTGLNLWETPVEHRKDHMYVIVNVFCVICLKHLYHHGYVLVCCNHYHILYSLMTYHWVCNKSNTTGATSKAGTAYSSEGPELTICFL